MPASGQTVERSAILGALTAPGWCCSDCPAVRLDFTDAQGRPFLLVAGAPDRARPEWHANFVFGYATTLVLPHRAPDAIEALRYE